MLHDLDDDIFEEVATINNREFTRDDFSKFYDMWHVKNSKNKDMDDDLSHNGLPGGAKYCTCF